MIRPLIASLTLVFGLLGPIGLPPASAQQAGDGDKRVALVISNSDYDNVGRLDNAANDASAIADKLEALGYEVTRRSNLTYADFRLVLREFYEISSSADVSAVYFAGHGIEIDRQNYLIPVDAVLRTDTAIEFEAIPLSLVTLAGSGSKRFRLIILDACRNNPFLKTMSRSVAKRSIGTGLASVEPETSDTLIAYAAREGTVAFDGSGEHSPYAAALLKYLDEPGIEIGTLFRKVRDQVLADTNGAQEPFVYGSLSSKDFYINPPAAAPVSAAPPPAALATPAQPTTDACRFAESHWQSVLSVDRAEFYEEHLRLFGACPFASLARLKLADLNSEARSVTDAPSNPVQKAAPKPAAPKKATTTRKSSPKPAVKAAPAPQPVWRAPPPAPAPVVQQPPKKAPPRRATRSDDCDTFAIRCQ